MDLDRAQYIKKPIVPYIPIVHDRIALELFRTGYTKGCRFSGGLYISPDKGKEIGDW
ncbi:MAG: hypothetical protein V8Q85_06075 [Christensenellales bacterium]